jgi:hypothetical protein
MKERKRPEIKKTVFNEPSPRNSVLLKGLHIPSPASYPSPRAVATINPQISPSHEAAGIAEQKHGRPAVLLWVTEALEHVCVGPCSAPLRNSLKQPRRHGRHDVARRDGVDADAVLAPFGRKVARQLDNGGFGGVISSRSWKLVDVSQLYSLLPRSTGQPRK